MTEAWTICLPIPKMLVYTWLTTGAMLIAWESVAAIARRALTR